jgi:radical SAM-linked protein
LHDPRLATIEGILGRGDRRIAEVIEAAYKAGARLDGWSEYFDYGRWEKAFADCGMPVDSLLDVRFVHQTLPWEHIDKGISIKFLLDERDRSFRGELPPGAAGRKERSAAQNSQDFGRKAKKRIIASASPTKSKVRIKYTRDNNLRFYSHLDMIRLFGRAIRRAGLPVSYSQGYHPHMKLSFGPPLPIGYSSEAEYLDIQLDSPFEKNYLAKFNSVLPPGMMITTTRLIYSNVESLTKVINCATYTIDISGMPAIEASKINELLSSSSLIVKRIKNEEIKEVEVRPLIRELSVADEQINMLLGFAPDVYVRPAEILVYGLGLDERLVQTLIFKRTGQFMLQGIHKVEPMDLV